MRAVGLVADPCFEAHDTGPGHPEKPERLVSAREAIEREGLSRRCRIVTPVAATDEQLFRVHEPGYVRRVEQVCASGALVLDSMDTAVCAASAEIARLAAGSVVGLSLEVARGGLAAGFAAVRPPGHHAERALAMGFCLFNSVAVAARALTAEAGIERVAILDWDVHHGNGTQHIFERDADVFYFSLHQWPLYPGTGARSEKGRGAGKGTTLNVPLAPGAGDDAFLGAIRDEFLPAMARFRPQFILISAGFDAHQHDPLAKLEVSTEAYAEATEIVGEAADRWAGGRVVSVLEGGYDLEALSETTVVHLRALLDR